MGKGNIMAGVMAGLGVIGKGMMDKDEEKRKDVMLAEERQREDARIAHQQKMAEREIDLREQSVKIANQTARQQQMMNEIKLANQHITQSFMTNKGNPVAVMDSINKYSNLKTKYQVDPALSNDKITTFTRGSYELNADGKPTLDKNTGNFKFIPQLDTEGNPMKEEFDAAGFNQYVSFLTRPDMAMAAYFQNEQRKEELKYGKELEQDKSDIAVAAEQATGKTALRGAQQQQAEAAAAKLTAEAENIKSGDSKTPTTVKGIAGKDVPLSKPQADLLINSLKSIKETFPGVDASEAYRLGEIAEDPEIIQQLDELATVTRKEPARRENAVKLLQKNYMLQPETARELLRQHEVGKAKSPWWKGFFN